MLKRALITGAAGFIGSHLVGRLLANGWSVTGLDNFDDFYQPRIKRNNLRPYRENPQFHLLEGDIRRREDLAGLTPECDAIVHLAARAGVRPSIADPILYQDVNVRGTQNLLEYARSAGVRQFVFASSSSVYGVNPRLPWREDDHVLEPISPYAATKVSGELLGHVYARLYGLRFIALRFFTVYGPRQRPDLAIHKFARLMMEGRPLPLFGDGSTRRDYTFVGDIVDGIEAAMQYRETDFEVINLGNNQTVSLMELIRGLENALNREARIEWLPEQPGDVPRTWADVSKARKLLGYTPDCSLREGLRLFADWMNAELPAAEPAAVPPAQAKASA